MTTEYKTRKTTILSGPFSSAGSVRFRICGVTYLAAAPLQVVYDGGAAVATLDPLQLPLGTGDLLHHLVPVRPAARRFLQSLQTLLLGLSQGLLV